MKYFNSPNFLKSLLFFFFLFYIGSLNVKAGLNAPQNVYDKVLYRIDSLVVQSITDVSDLDIDVKKLLDQQNTDGSWLDIDYASRSQTLWNPLTHLSRLNRMVSAYINPSSIYYNDGIYYNAIANGLDFWYKKDPRSSNWYNQQIACPKYVGLILCLMREGDKKLPAELEQKLLDRMIKIGGRPDQPGSLGSAANKMNIATHWFYRGVLMHDEAVFSFAIQQILLPLKITTQEGIQQDFSFQQHGKQLYIGGYGAVLLEHIPKLLCYLKDTKYYPEKKQTNSFFSFIRHTYFRTIRGRYQMFNVRGRSMAKKNAFDCKSDISFLRLLTFVDPEYASYYNNSIDRLSQNQPANYEMPHLLTYYWCSDYMLYTSPLWNFDVRMLSKRIERMENGNGENLRGYFLSDGATCITRTGYEYENIMPYWDWSMIPGTTAPHINKKQIPIPTPWGNLGVSNFTGGLSNGIYGFNSYVYNDTASQVQTGARKSYFFLGKEVYCMGSNINSKSDKSVFSTLNQCKPNGYTVVDKKHQWIIQDKIAYKISSANKWNFTNSIQHGDWHDIVSRYPSEVDSGKVFKLWIDHGVQPKDASYEYSVVAGITSEKQLQKYLATRKIEVVQCDSKAHAINTNVGNLRFMAVVFRKGCISSNDMVIKVDHPCLLMVTDKYIYASVPNSNYSELLLRVTDNVEHYVGSYQLNFNNSIGSLGKSIRVER